MPLSKTGAELLFEVFSQRYERGSILVTSNLPFDEWTEIFGSERLTGALLDRLTHHVHILEMNGESYRLNQSQKRRKSRRENIIALGNSGTGKTHIALGLGLAACQKGLSVGFLTAAALVHELMEARDEKRLLRLQKQLAKYHLLIIDELGFVPLSKTGAELLFEVFSQRYERGSILVTSNLPFDEWTEIFGSERLTGALLDRLTHHVHILEMNGESYRLNQSQKRRESPKIPA